MLSLMEVYSMTDTTPLSPAADAVLDAYMNNCGWLDGPLERDYRCAAAVLRAVVEQVLYEEKLGWTGYGYYTQFQNQILAIADELENNV